MIIRSRTTVFAATALVLVAGLAGCSASGSSAETPPTPTSSSTAKPAEIAIDPLQAYLMPDKPADASLGDKYEQVVKACMEEQGFEYTPLPDNAATNSTPLDPPREWVAEHGAGLIEHDIGVDYSVGDGASDPNNAYLGSLSSAERSAYDLAMNGKAADTTGQTDWDNLTWQDRGCQGKASHEVYPKLDEAQPPIIADAQTFLNSLRTDPKVVALDEEVTTCMAAAGYSDFRLSGTFDESKTKPSGWRADYFEYRASHSPLQADDPKVAEFKKLEIDQALAQWDCKQDADYDKRKLALYTDLEKDYIAEHKGELDEAKLWLNK